MKVKIICPGFMLIMCLFRSTGYYLVSFTFYQTDFNVLSIFVHLSVQACREFNKPLWIAYVDLKSAFDSVDHDYVSHFGCSCVTMAFPIS